MDLRTITLDVPPQEVIRACIEKPILDALLFKSKTSPGSHERFRDSIGGCSCLLPGVQCHDLGGKRWERSPLNKVSLNLNGQYLAHRYATFLLKYSIGWRPQKDSIEKRSDWEKIWLRKDPIEKRFDWEKIRLRKDPIEKRSNWEKTRLRKDQIEKPADWVTQGLRPYRTYQEEGSFSQDRHLVKIGKPSWSKQWIIKVWAVKMVRSSGSEQWIIKKY